MATSKFTIDGNAQGAVANVTALNAAIDNTEKGFKKTAQASVDLGKGLEQLVKKHLPDQERYNQKIRELDALQKAGLLTAKEVETQTLRYKAALDRAADSGRNAFGMRFLTQVQGIAAGVLSVTGAVALLRKELQAQVDLSDKIATRQQTGADARRDLKKNIFALPDADRQQVLAASASLASELNLPQAVVDRSLASAVSAAGADKRAAIQATKTALSFERNPEEAIILAGALLDVGNATGDASPARALGLLSLTGQQSRTTQLQALASNAPRVINAVSSGGGTAEQGAALFAALTVGNADYKGEVARTAGIQFVDKFDEYFKKTFADRFASGELSDFAPQMAFLLANRSEAARFLDATSFEAGASVGVNSLLLDSSSAARATYNETLRSLGGKAEQEAAGVLGIDFLRSGRLEDVSRTQDIVTSTAEQLQLATDTTALTKDSRAALLDISQQLKGSRIGAELSSLLDSGLITSRDEASSALRGLASGLRSTEYVLGGVLDVPRIGPPSAADQQTIDLLTRAAESLDTLSKRQNQAVTTRQE